MRKSWCMSFVPRCSEAVSGFQLPASSFDCRGTPGLNFSKITSPIPSRRTWSRASRSGPLGAGTGSETPVYIMSVMKSAAADTARDRWQREVLDPALKKSPERSTPFTTISGRSIERLYTGEDVHELDYARDLNDPGRFPYTSGHSSDGLPRQALDDEAVRGLRDTGGNQRPLQDPARGWRDRPQRRVRPSDVDGPRSRSRALARRSGEVRRQHRVARRHGAAVRRHRSRWHHHVDDDQLAGADALRDVPGSRREAGRRLEAALWHDPERHPQGVHRAEGVHLSAARIDAAHHRCLRLLQRGKCRAGTPCR